MLKVENLYKNFGNITAVDGISFEVNKGEVFGLLGPNGAGKSTTISIISTLLKPTGGEVLFEGESIFSNPKAIRRKLGVVPQDIALYPTLSGYENLRFWGNLYGLRGETLKQRISDVAEIIGLNGRLRDKVEKYSGGMKRRLNIGAALLHKPELLIMDEPTVGIDPQSRTHILDTVLKLKDEGLTIIYTTHYMEEAENLCSRICIMDEGKVIASGTQQELVELVKEKTQISIKLDSVNDSILDSFKNISGVIDVKLDEDTVNLYGENGDILLAQIIAKVSEHKKQIQSIDVKKPNLEAVFLHLTGKALRDV